MTRRVRALYRREHVENPEFLGTSEDVDALIDSLLMGSADKNLAELHSLERPLLPSGFPDHELLVGADKYLQVGVLEFMDNGNWVTVGSPKDQAGEVRYFNMGHATEFPSYSEISITLVRQAVKEFLESGGRRPTCVEWRVPEFW